MFFELEIVKGVHSGCGFEKYITALAAVPAVWSPFGDVFLSPETDAAIAAIPRLDGDQGFIKKLHVSRITVGTLLPQAFLKRARYGCGQSGQRTLC